MFYGDSDRVFSAGVRWEEIAPFELVSPKDENVQPCIA